MVKRNRLRSTRPKAVFGAIATLAGSIINGIVSANNARREADAITQAAEKQAEALRLQNENANKNQEEMIAFLKNENDLNRKMQEQYQLQSQLQAGQQNDIALREATKIQVKKGGSMRRKLRNTPISFLRGKNGNLPFVVTDGGGVLSIGTTPEGYDLYEIIGNDHEHYHKAQGGKNKTGVGIKFANSDIIEGEGNQNTNQGEYMLVTPNDAKFISKHTIKGINPAELVNEGMHPLQAFNIQENIKNAYDIPDFGNYAKCGRSLKSNRRRAAGGIRLNNWWKGLDDTQKGNIWGSGFNALGNLGGAFITTLGNNAASRYLNGAYDTSSNIIANAYNNLRTIDMSALDRNAFRSSHAMAALQAPIVNSGAQRAAAERNLNRGLRTINRGTLSSAAAQNRMQRLYTNYNDVLSGISEADNNIRQSIIQGNMDRLTNTSAMNAQLDTQANQAYANANLSLMQYNNEIENERITGAAQARADAILNKASNIAGTKQANAASWSNALTTGLSGIQNALVTNAKMNNELRMSMLGASTENLYNYYLNNPYAPGFESFANRFKNDKGNYNGWYENLMNARRI